MVEMTRPDAPRSRRKESEQILQMAWSEADRRYMGKIRRGLLGSQKVGHARLTPLVAALLALATASALLPAFAAAPKPDLIIRSVSQPPATRIQGQKFKVTDTTKNKGNKKAGKSKTGYYLSSDKSKSNNDVRLLGTRGIPALNPGTKSRGSKSVGIPLSTPVASYFLIACVDDLKAIGEGNEANNCKASQTKIDVTLKDAVAPDAPENLATNPDSPSSDPTPEVSGTAEPDSTVRIFQGSNCGGSLLGTEQATSLGNFDIIVTVPNDATTALSANARDASNNTSDCSTSINYKHDGTAPAPPSNVTTTPTSPANDNTVLVSGTAEAGSSVQIFTMGDDNCENSIGGGPTGSAATFASPGIEVTVPNDSTTPFHARATDAVGNVSDCGGGVQYTEDSSAPGQPNLTGTDPASPSSNNNPKLQGTAEATAAITIYSTNDCTGPVHATGGESALSGAGIPLNVGPDTTTSFSATATDASGNVSPCSNSITYVEDSTAPVAPSGLSSIPLASSGRVNDNNPEVTGTVEAGSQVTIHTGGLGTVGCNNPVAVGVAAQFTSTGVTTPVGNNSSNLIRATATDAAGNTSPCSSAVTYLEETPQTELENNNTTPVASRFPGITSGIQGSAVGTDPDLYQVIVPNNGFVRAETKNFGFNSCSIDTIVTLLDPGGNVIATDDNDGDNNCSLIDGTPTGGADAGAKNLAAGTYFLRVDNATGVGTVNYELRKHVGRVTAENEIDPNATPAEADTTTTANPSLLITGDKTLQGGLTLGDRDVYKMNLSAPQILHLELFNSTGVDCTPGMTTNLLLFDSAGNPISLTAEIRTAGIHSCSAITQEFPAGVSYVGVEENGQDAAIGIYRLEVLAITDAGNESESNDNTGTADVIAGTNFVVSGDHELETDIDFYKISVPVGSSVTAQIIDGNGNLVETCASNGIDSVIALRNSSGTLLAEDDDDGVGFCSLLDGTGSPPLSTSIGPADYGASVLNGDHYLSVRSFSTNATNKEQFDYRLVVMMR